VLLYGYFRPSGVLNPQTAGHPANQQAMIVFGIASVAVFLLSVPAVVYSIIMALRYSLAVPASVVEDLKARKALRRSIDLSKGARGRIFILGLLISVIQVGLVGLTQILFIVASFQAIKQHHPVPAWLQVLQQVVGFFTNSFIGPMYATGLTLFYYDQRIRKEGFDIEWMMQAAGLSAPVAPTPRELPAPQDEPGAVAGPLSSPDAPVEPAEPTSPAQPEPLNLEEGPGSVHE
jgi:hypothetical protein